MRKVIVKKSKTEIHTQSPTPYYASSNQHFYKPQKGWGKKKKKRKLNNLLDKEKSYMHSVPFNTLISTQVSLY